MRASLVVLVVVTLLVHACALPRNSPRFAERRRAGGISSSAKVECAKLSSPTEWANALSGITLTRGGAGDTNKLVKFSAGVGSGAAGKFTYIAGVNHNVDDKPLSTTDEIKFEEVDLCKVFPQTVCGQTNVAWTGTAPTSSTNFCAQGTNNKKLCCPLAGRADRKFDGTKKAPGAKPILTTGCTPHKVAGVARAFMPQIDKEDEFLTWFKTLDTSFNEGGTAANKDLNPQNIKVKLDEILPSQDEMFFFKTVKKICADPSNPHGTAGYMVGPTFTLTPLAICKKSADGVANKYFILDGHHRYSQKALCSAVKGCAPHAADTAANLDEIGVRVFDESCSNLIYATHHLIDYSKEEAKLQKLDVAAGKGLTAVNKGIHFAQGAFTELEELFGRAAHQTEAQAARAYVEHARERLARVGLSLKGGDEALQQYWEVNHKPKLWN